MKLTDIETPALLIDLNALELNLKKMANFFEKRPCKIRPHFKNHKSPALAWKQLEAGAIGITCATLREAEILVQRGFRDILIANEIADEYKLNQLADCSSHASVVVAVDHEKVIKDMARIQRNRKVKLDVVVDINIGLNRCGVPPGMPAVQLGRLAAAEGLNVRGIMGYDGHLQAEFPTPERDARVREGCRALADTAVMMVEAGVPVSIVSTGGTGTCFISGDCPGITDVQVGSYLLMDTRYMNLGAPFCRSLSVLASVISKRESRHAVLDCGVKAISGERGLPQLKDVMNASVVALHAEHALIEFDPNPSLALEIGKKVEMWVQYSDATVNLHHRMYGVRNGEVEEVFQIQH